LFRKDSLSRNISVLVSGTVLAQVVPIALQPVLKRLYTPEDFGVLDIYLKTLGILFVVFALKYDMGVVLPKNRVKALMILSLSVMSALTFCLISLLILFLFEQPILDLLQFPAKYKFALYLLPFSTLFFSLFNSFNYLLIRDKKFYASSINKINRRATEGGIQIALAYVPMLKKAGLFIGDIIGNLIYFLSAFFQSIKTIKIDKRFFNFRLLLNVAKEYSDLPKYNIIPELLNTGFLAAISFLVLTKFNIEEVGYMELTQRILAIPSAFISFSAGQVLLQKITELVNDKKPITKEIKNVFYMLLAMAVPFVLVILLYANPIFSFAFGKEWEVSGLYAKYLVMFYALGFLISPLSQVLIGLKEFKVNAIWKIARFTVILPLFFINFSDITSYLLSYSILGSITYIVYFFIIMHYSGKFDKTLLNGKN
jgi:O-antigen/teichoic acid export membrane protein